MRNNAGSQFRHRIPTVPADILWEAIRTFFFKQDGRRRNYDAAHGAEGGNAATVDLTQIGDLTLCHVRCRLFDGVTNAFTLHKDHRVARLAAAYLQRHNSVSRP